ncbi:hypothetical protein F5Y14DRAFT_130647 [Nemania sp. NC0429]|nr:hypothetical protein F5Y14DRAFT_130647 [Nemania sp. NC0429]
MAAPQHTTTAEHQLAWVEASLGNLAQAAAECYAKRLDYDTQSVIFIQRDARRERERADVCARLSEIRHRATILRSRREVLRAQIPASRLFCAQQQQQQQSSSSTTDPVPNLDSVLLQLEQQHLANVFATTDHAQEQLARTSADIEGVQDEAVRDALGDALEKVQGALRDFRKVVYEVGEERSRAIDIALMRAAPGPACQVHSDGDGEYHDVDSGLGSSDDMDTSIDNDNDIDADADVADVIPSISSLTLNPVHVDETTTTTMMLSAAEKEYMTARLVRFDRGDPPTLLRLANWLGLSDAVQAAMLLNSRPIQTAFATYQESRREGRRQLASSNSESSSDFNLELEAESDSIAEDPARLRLVMPLGLFSRDTILAWREGVGSGFGSSSSGRSRRGRGGDKRALDAKVEKWRGVDFDAALFANRVVRFLENSVDEVEWTPLAGRVASPGDYEVARQRWAVVLQILWFLEKAFAPAPAPPRDGGVEVEMKVERVSFTYRPSYSSPYSG